MNASARIFRAPAAARQRGVSLVETMVGILIGLIVVAVIYNTLIVAEGFRRSTLGASDAQVTGQLSQFILGRELANAGNGVMSGEGVDVLANCTDAALRPMPALIQNNVAADTPTGASVLNDRLTVFYSSAPRIVHPVRVEAPVQVVATDPISVASPNGFRVDDWFLATDRLGQCMLGQVTAITQPDNSAYPPAAPGGFVKLTFNQKFGANGASPGFAVGTSRVINLGRDMRRTTYSINKAKLQLDTTDDNPGLGAAVTAPLAQNVVLLKAQYGVDTDNDQVADCWTPADASNTCGLDFSQAVFTGAPPANMAARIRAIKAIRVAIVVRSDDQAKADATNATLVGQSAWIFNCAANNASCQSRIALDSTVLRNYNRYRIYEATIPLRNSIWNAP